MNPNLAPARELVNPTDSVKERQGYIGATDITRILGLAPESWGGPVQVQREKLGLVEPANLDDVEVVRAGEFLEPGIAELYAWKTGRAVRKAPVALYRDGGVWLEPVASHPDYETDDRLVEIKATGVAAPMTRDRREMWGEDGTDEVPVHIGAQVQYQMACTGHRLADVAALIGGDGLRVFTVEYDEQVAMFMVHQAREFWQRHVLPVLCGECTADECAPDPRTAADLALRYPRDNGSVVEGGQEHVEKIHILNTLKDSRKDLDSQIESIETEIKLAIGDASALVVDGRTVATWKASQSSRIDSKLLRELHPDIAAQVTKVTTSRRFLPKKVEVA